MALVVHYLIPLAAVVFFFTAAAILPALTD